MSAIAHLVAQTLEVKLPPSRSKGSRITPLLRRSIIEMRSNGSTITEITWTLHCSRATTYKVLDEFNKENPDGGTKKPQGSGSQGG